MKSFEQMMWESFLEIKTPVRYSFWDGIHVGGIVIAKLHDDFEGAQKYYVFSEKATNG